MFHFTLDNHKQQHFLYQLFPSFCKINDCVKIENYPKKNINACVEDTQKKETFIDGKKIGELIVIRNPFL